MPSRYLLCASPSNLVNILNEMFLSVNVVEDSEMVWRCWLSRSRVLLSRGTDLVKRRSICFVPEQSRSHFTGFTGSVPKCSSRENKLGKLLLHAAVARPARHPEDVVRYVKAFKWLLKAN